MDITNRLARNLNADLNVLLVGSPGTGKTAIAHAVALAAGYQLEVMRASLMERVDASGALVPDTKSGMTKILPLAQLHRLKNATEKTLLFLDDIGQGPIDVQAGFMQFFDKDFFPNCVRVWGATNRPGDKAGVSALCEPLRSRFHLAYSMPTPGTEDKPDGSTLLYSWSDAVEQWSNWAMDKEAAPEIVAWHRSTTGRTLYQWKPHADPALRMADYRSWETVMNLRKHGIKDLQTTAAAIGKPTAAEYCAFEALADRLPTPDQVRIDPKGCPVPQEPASLYLITSMLASAAKAQDATPFVTYLCRLPRVYGALLARDMYRRLGAALSGNKCWTTYFVENQKLFI